MRMWLIILALAMVMEAPLPIPPDTGGCRIVIMNGKACMVCPNIIQC